MNSEQANHDQSQTRSMLFKKILIFLGTFLLHIDMVFIHMFHIFILVFLVLFCASGYLTLQAYFAFNEELKKIGNRKYQLKIRKMSKTNHLSEETINESPYGGIIEF